MRPAVVPPRYFAVTSLIAEPPRRPRAATLGGSPTDHAIRDPSTRRCGERAGVAADRRGGDRRRSCAFSAGGLDARSPPRGDGPDTGGRALFVAADDTPGACADACPGYIGSFAKLLAWSGRHRGVARSGRTVTPALHSSLRSRDPGWIARAYFFQGMMFEYSSFERTIVFRRPVTGVFRSGMPAGFVGMGERGPRRLPPRPGGDPHSRARNGH